MNHHFTCWVSGNWWLCGRLTLGILRELLLFSFFVSYRFFNRSPSRRSSTLSAFAYFAENEEHLGSCVSEICWLRGGDAGQSHVLKILRTFVDFVSCFCPACTFLKWFHFLHFLVIDLDLSAIHLQEVWRREQFRAESKSKENKAFISVPTSAGLLSPSRFSFCNPSESAQGQTHSGQTQQWTVS